MGGECWELYRALLCQLGSSEGPFLLKLVRWGKKGTQGTLWGQAPGKTDSLLYQGQIFVSNLPNSSPTKEKEPGRYCPWGYYELALPSLLIWIMWEANRGGSRDGEVRGLRVPGISG